MKDRSVIIVDEAIEDIREEIVHHDEYDPGSGKRFADYVFSEINRLKNLAGIHPIRYGTHQMLLTRYPHAVFYTFENDAVTVVAILDLRRDPTHMRKRLNP